MFAPGKTELCNGTPKELNMPLCIELCQASNMQLKSTKYLYTYLYTKEFYLVTFRLIVN